MAVTKKKVIKSLDTLSEDLKELLRRQYPGGYENSITRITTPKKEPIFVFPLEDDEATYLVKVPATKNSDGEYNVDSKPKDPEFERVEKDETNAFEGDDDFNGVDDFDADADEGEDSGKDPSYEPDFDN